MNPIDEPPADLDAPMPELLEDYKSHHEKLVAHTRQLQRLREQVRSTAEREAATIVTNARRDVRKTLLDARHELLVLVAQLQAVGCESKSSEQRSDIQGEAVAADAEPDPFSDTREIVSGARRDVREVLLEARAELLSLDDEGRNLRAWVAEQRSLANEPANFLPENPPPAEERAPEAPAPAPAHAGNFGRIGDRDSIFDVQEVSRPTPEPTRNSPSPPPIAAVRGRAAVAPPMHYTAPQASRSIWIACASAVAFAAVAVFLLWLWPGSTRETAASGVENAGTERPPATPAAAPPASADAVAALAKDPSIVSVVVDAKRASWIRATVDGAGDRGRLFAAGEKTTLTGRQDVVIRAGDAGAVFVSVDGQPAQALGSDGQVITRRFSPRQPRAAAVAADAAAKTPPRARDAMQASAQPAPPLPERETSPAPRADVGTAGTVEPASPFKAAPAAFAPALSPSPAVPAPEAAPPPAEPPARPAPTQEFEIINANSRWFEAYYAGDRATMQAFASADFTLADERTGNRLPPSPVGGVQRSMDQIRVEVAGDGAVLSARLTERLTIDGEPVQRVSMVSQVWIRQGGRWRLVNVRFIDAANLGLGLR